MCLSLLALSALFRCPLAALDLALRAILAQLLVLVCRKFFCKIPGRPIAFIGCWAGSQLQVRLQAPLPPRPLSRNFHTLFRQHPQIQLDGLLGPDSFGGAADPGHMLSELPALMTSA